MKHSGNSILCVIFVCFAFACKYEIPTTRIHVKGTEKPVICLNGNWKFTMEPPENFFENSVNPNEWNEIAVPGECAMQGFSVKHDMPFVYKKKIDIPDDFTGKIIQLYFEGVYNYARVWINGKYAGEHRGGFTPWLCDITALSSPGDSAWITIEVSDFMDDISYGSGYGKHPIGGILRNVWLKALPLNHFTSLFFETKFDKNLRDAELLIHYHLSRKNDAILHFSLYDKEENRIAVLHEKVNARQTAGSGVVSISVSQPLKWDAEHPNLYTLVAEITEDGKTTYIQTDRIGFREVNVEGNRLLVNGMPVKLRGANRHSIHALLGRSDSKENDSLDAVLAGEANINFIRTSHYPPTKAFLEFCDRFGIYVESESAVCFMSTHRTDDYAGKEKAYDPEEQIISQFHEMVEANRNHPCCIVWSLGNESTYRPVFQELYSWVSREDPTRPVIFSYPGSVPDSVKCYDILSMHYPSSEGNLNQQGIAVSKFRSDSIPVLYDEWAHVACYNKPTLQTDPNVRDFWGQSLDRMWSNLFEEPGGLGGAIWCMIDETFMMPEGLPGQGEWWGISHPGQIPMPYEGPVIGYGEWGIIDTWRRKKPEFWNTKKAYSPAKILIKEASIKEGELKIPVFNRFDHTNFSELIIAWNYGGISGKITPPDIAPHRKGNLIIPAMDWKKGKYLGIDFFKNDSFLVDRYQIQINPENTEIEISEDTGSPEIIEKGNLLQITGENFQLNFDRRTGLLDAGIYNQDTLLKGGPFLNLIVPGKSTVYSASALEQIAKEWQLRNFITGKKNDRVLVGISGKCGKIEADFLLTIDGLGSVKTEYKFRNLPEHRIFELGCRYAVSDHFTQLSWKRNGYWTSYPEGHLGQTAGSVQLRNLTPEKYRMRQEKTWEQDTKNFYYLGLTNPIYKFSLTNQARAKKENVITYSLSDEKGNTLSVKGDGKISCRINQDSPYYIDLLISGKWDYPDLSWGNWIKDSKTGKDFSGEFSMISHQQKL